jgi:coatomer protein complex subunit gamma
MKTLAGVANFAPMAVVKCNEDMEVLISDSNRSIATLAITTLLKTGNEGGVERLMKQISSFMNDIGDEYKIAVVKSIRQLCLKYPGKHRVLIGFLSNFLREEGGYQFKKAIVDGIVFLTESIPSTKESGLLHLCEFIEDCEFTALSTAILHLIGSMGPTTAAPNRYIRFIYNRVILENAAVRAAAVSALAKFGAQVPSLRTSILTLLQRSLSDEDDEVRDRAALSVDILSRAIESNGYPSLKTDPDALDEPAADDVAAFLLLEQLPMSFGQLERSVKAYEATPGAMDSEEGISYITLPVVEEIPEDVREIEGEGEGGGREEGGNGGVKGNEVREVKGGLRGKRKGGGYNETNTLTRTVNPASPLCRNPRQP